jgi:hypothetical protein
MVGGGLGLEDASLGRGEDVLEAALGRGRSVKLATELPIVEVVLCQVFETIDHVKDEETRVGLLGQLFLKGSLY